MNEGNVIKIYNERPKGEKKEEKGNDVGKALEMNERLMTLVLKSHDKEVNKKRRPKAR